MESCIFCRIIKGEIPSEILLQDENVVVFKDINPQAPVHLLIVQKVHIPTLLEKEATDGKLLASVYKVVQSLVPKFGLEKGVRVVANFGEEAGQSVFHIHFHLLGKRRMSWPPG